jgi:hypothetical protein
MPRTQGITGKTTGEIMEATTWALIAAVIVLVGVCVLLYTRGKKE